MKRNKIRTLIFSIIAGISTCSSNVFADDVDIYLTESAPKSTANVLIFLDTSSSMNGTKIDTLKEGFREFIISLSDDAKIGLGRNNSTYGSTIMYPISRLGDSVLHHDGSTVTVREELIYLVNELEVGGGAPLKANGLESYQYFGGKDVLFGKKRANTKGEIQRVSHPDSWTGGVLHTPSKCFESDYNNKFCSNEYISGDAVYKSPLSVSTCESNHIITLTAGQPSNGSITIDDVGGINNEIAKITKKSCSGKWDCVYDIAEALATRDVSDLDGFQNVYSHVIGFGNDALITRLENLANKGSGMFVPIADNKDELVDSFNLIFSEIGDYNGTISMPGVAVDQSNRLLFKNDLYYSVFKPSNKISWNGNLKRYKIGAVDDGLGIVDVNGDPAINLDTGFFNEDSQSFWSSYIDGFVATEGGAAKEIGVDRNFFTYTVDGIKNTSFQGFDYSLSKNNTKLTKEMFNIPSSVSDVSFDMFLDWVSGYDVKDEDGDGFFTDARNVMGDPLHAKPLVLGYGNDNSTVFISTNEGVLHGINSKNGKELMAFTPKELLPNLYKGYRNTIGKHQYGLDLTWIGYKHDDDKDGTIGSDSKDFTYIYGGMRRGGSSLFAMDVTNIHAGKMKSARVPKLKWVIDPTTSSEFSTMGQTWSTPIMAKIKLNGVDKIVLIFGGGYDLINDTHDKNNADSYGNQLYIVDAETGNLLWWASGSSSLADLKVSGMDFSIPAKITSLDFDNDGYIDYIYANDMGGQILKFKINHLNSGSGNLVKGKVFASLGHKTYIPYDRRFYERPIIVPVKDNGIETIMVVAGSGHRAVPVSKKTQDGLFVIKDDEVITGVFDVSALPITLSNLLNVTHNKNETLIKSYLSTTKKGYVIYLNKGLSVSNPDFEGEKILGDMVVLDGELIFSTYLPDENSNNSCVVAAIGHSRKYKVKILTGAPSSNEKETTSNVNEERYVDEILPGLSSGTKVIYTKDGPIAISNTKIEKEEDVTGIGFSKSNWKRLIEENDITPEHIEYYRKLFGVE